jgi:hypothetical protein
LRASACDPLLLPLALCPHFGAPPLQLASKSIQPAGQRRSLRRVSLRLFIGTVVGPATARQEDDERQQRERRHRAHPHARLPVRIGERLAPIRQ